ncbi:MAG: ABC transporter substrate-binding protein [Xanthobacteraceae bacterium]
MRRREFVTFLGGAAAWPVAARAQRREKMRRIGVLMNLAAEDAEGQARLAAFLQGLQEAGWGVGRNTHIDIRWGAGSAERYRTYAAELVALAPDVVLAAAGSTVPALLQATRAVPIVFAQTPDPVGAGFVDSLARPGGNVTGFTPFEFGMSGKSLELLKEIVPRVTRAAVLRDAADPGGIGRWAAIQSMAPSLGVEVILVPLRDPGEIDRALTAFASGANGGLIVTASAPAAIHRELIIESAAKHGLPAVYPYPFFASSGGAYRLWA